MKTVEEKIDELLNEFSNNDENRKYLELHLKELVLLVGREQLIKDYENYEKNV